MKKLNLLSKAEMRNVIGGTEPVDGGGICIADCSIGGVYKSVTCQGKCSATDGVGCNGTDALNEAYTKVCPTS